MRLFRWFVGLAAAAALSLAVIVPAAFAAEVDLRAHLNGSASFPNAVGSSEYDRGGGERDVHVFVRHIGNLAGTRVTFYLAGQKIGTVRVSGLGTARIERESDEGQFVPFASAGDRVSVRRTSNGVLVARGTYFRVFGD